MGLCSAGPLVEVESTESGEKVMYRDVTADDAQEVVDSLDGEPVERLLCSTDAPFFALQKKVVLENSGVIDPEQIDDYIEAGGYAALYNPRYMAVVGHDGEQLRAAAGYLAPESRPRYRPSLEVLYFDHTVGELTGPEVIFINGTLKYGGGFLSQPIGVRSGGGK